MCSCGLARWVRDPIIWALDNHLDFHSEQVMETEQVTEEERIERLRAGLSETTLLLYRLWRCNTDRERAELGWEIAEVVERYAKHPSHLKEQGL